MVAWPPFSVRNTRSLTKVELIDFEIQLQSIRLRGVDAHGCSHNFCFGDQHDVLNKVWLDRVWNSTSVDTASWLRLQLDFKIDQFKLCEVTRRGHQIQEGHASIREHAATKRHALQLGVKINWSISDLVMTAWGSTRKMVMGPAVCISIYGTQIMFFTGPAERLPPWASSPTSVVCAACRKSVHYV